MFAQLSSASETLKPSSKAKSINAGEDEQYCASMQNMSMEILSRLQELACDITLATFSMQGIEIGFDVFSTRTYPGKYVAFPKDGRKFNLSIGSIAEIEKMLYIPSIPPLRQRCP